MQKFILSILTLFLSTIIAGQKIETLYLDSNDSTSDMYVAVVPKSGQINSFMVLLDGFGNDNPIDILIQTELPRYASGKGILIFRHNTNRN